MGKAWLVETYGGEFRKVDLPRPTLAKNQVLVRISASGVNPLDTKIRAGKAAHAKQPLPAVLGLDMAGTVEEVSPGVTAFHPGDEVYGMAGGVGGLQGTLAELIAVDADLLAHKPRNLSMRQVAALPLSVITAWEGLVDRARVHAGQSLSTPEPEGLATSRFRSLAPSEQRSSPPCRRKRRPLLKPSEPTQSTTVHSPLRNTSHPQPRAGASTSSTTRS